MSAAPAVTHLNNYANIFALNETFMTSIHHRAEICGYFDFMTEAMTFPPAGKFELAYVHGPECNVWGDIVEAAIYVNPCFNIYHLTDVSALFPFRSMRCSWRVHRL
jgi:carboxypeptidase D